MTHDEMIEVIKAAKEGKIIQARKITGYDPVATKYWCDYHNVEKFDFFNFEYRVKSPEVPGC